MVFSARQLHLNTMILLPGLSNLRRLSNLVVPGRVLTRRYSTAASVNPGFEKLESELMELIKASSRSVVALLSYFPGPENREIAYSARRGTGFFVDPTLIVTSARVVGTLSTVYDSDRSSIIHNSFIARTIALTSDDKVLRTKPVAVNFAGDVAVLEVLNPREIAADLPPPLAVTNSVPEIGSPLVAIIRHENVTGLRIVLPENRRRRGKSIRPKAPWPLDDQLKWIDYGGGERINTVSIADISGSPWFNIGNKEVVGMASWAAEEADGCLNSYSVHPVFINQMVGHAKTKEPQEPVVLDRWINALTIADNTSDIVQECVPKWPGNVITQMFA